MHIGSRTVVDSGNSRYAEVLRNIWPMLLVIAVFLIVQQNCMAAWWKVWNMDDSYYSHGILVPFLFGIMVWTRRHHLKLEDIKLSNWGILLLAFFLPSFAIGSLTGVREFQAIAFIIGLFGISLLILGAQITKVLAIPFLFLSTMMPISGFLLDAATGRFQLISTAVATTGLKIGMDVQQIGNTIVSDSLPEPLLIGVPCSGLRLLISLITFSWLFVYIFEASWWKKSLLVLLVLPLSIFINSLRIALIGVVGVITDSVEWMHKFHDYSGMIGLILCFIILFAFAKFLRFGDLFGSGEKPNPKTKSAGRQPVHGMIIALIILSIPILLSKHIASLYDYPKGKIDIAKVPTTMDLWTHTDQQIDESTRKTLDTGDLLSRTYVDNADTQRQVDVFLDVAYDYTAFHDPHLCLPGGGSPISSDQLVNIDIPGKYRRSVTATRLQATSEYGSNLLIYWYQAGDISVPGTRDIYTVFRNWRIADLKRIIAKPWELPQLRKDIFKRKITWYRFCTSMQENGKDDEFLIGFIKKWSAKYGEL
jgi:exosortase